MTIIEKARVLRVTLQQYFEDHPDDDNTPKIVCSVLFDEYVQAEYHNVGDIRLDENGYPYECILAYDGAIQPDWTIHTATLWKPYHSTLPEYALPWVAPTGAHDIYKAGEYMVYTDGDTYKCLVDTNFSPTDYPAGWEDITPQPEPEPTPGPEPEPEPEPTPEPEPEPEPEIPDWVQPDASNPYNRGVARSCITHIAKSL